MLSVLIIVSVALTGCVSQKKHKELQSRLDLVNAQMTNCQKDLIAAQSRIMSLEELIEVEKKK